MSKPYEHILLAVDFSPETKHLVNKAVDIAKVFDAKITLIHAYERDVAATHLFVDENAYEQMVIKNVTDKLNGIVDKDQIPKSNWKVEIGTPKQVIINAAEKWNCDLILLGSHGRHGLQRILGSTANAVLNIAHRDVHIIWYRD